MIPIDNPDAWRLPPPYGTNLTGTPGILWRHRPPPIHKPDVPVKEKK